MAGSHGAWRWVFGNCGLLLGTKPMGCFSLGIRKVHDGRGLQAMRQWLAVY
jgi:hypothetical protein